MQAILFMVTVANGLIRAYNLQMEMKTVAQSFDTQQLKSCYLQIFC